MGTIKHSENGIPPRTRCRAGDHASRREARAAAVEGQSIKEEHMEDMDKKVPEEAQEEVKAPVSEICGNAEELAASLVDDDSEIKPVEGFFLTSQRWH